MSKKPEVSKSQAIRDHQKVNPGDGPKAVAAALKKQGIKVTAAFVSTIRSMDKRRAERLTYVDLDPTTDIGQLLEAKKFAAGAGGIDKAVKVLMSLRALSE